MGVANDNKEQKERNAKSLDMKKRKRKKVLLKDGR